MSSTLMVAWVARLGEFRWHRPKVPGLGVIFLYWLQASQAFAERTV
jgi:hypothetical protein